MIDLDFIEKDLSENYEREVEYLAQKLIKYRERKASLIQSVKDGLFDPVLEYYHFTGSGIWPMYFSMPLDKPLFFKKVDELKNIGWKLDGNLSMSSRQVTQSMSYGEYPDKISLQLTAVGEGVNCRLVKLEEEQNWKPGVYEWVCEEGAQEMEEINEIRQDEANPMYRSD